MRGINVIIIIIIIIIKHAFDRQTDRQTDRILIARPRLHSMQRGKNYYIRGTN